MSIAMVAGPFIAADGTSNTSEPPNDPRVVIGVPFGVSLLVIAGLIAMAGFLDKKMLVNFERIYEKRRA